MENTRYRAVMAAAELGSFTKAAERLGYTPSGVSQLVKAFEQEVGFPVLLRDKKGVRPTEDGHKILPVVRDILLQEERLEQMASDINGLATGRVTIGAFSSISAHWLPKVIKSFQTKYPDIEISVMEGIHQELDEWLVSRRVDCVFYSRLKRQATVEWIPLREEPMLAILPTDHPLAGETAFPIERINEERFIMPGLGVDNDVAGVLARNNLHPKISFTTIEDYATMGMVEQGLGISVLDELITKRWECNVVKMPLDPPQFITFGIAIRSMKRASPAMKRFVDFAVKMLTAPKNPGTEEG